MSCIYVDSHVNNVNTEKLMLYGYFPIVAYAHFSNDTNFSYGETRKEHWAFHIEEF